MAILKVPRITTIQRQALTLEIGEIVFDIDNSSFYGGDGSSSGGFPIGRGGSGSNTVIKTLSQSDIENKKLVLAQAPSFPTSVTLTPIGGIPQANGIDFEVIGNELHWSGMGLDGFLEENEQLIVSY